MLYKGPARSLALAQVGARARRGRFTVEYQSHSQQEEVFHSGSQEGALHSGRL